MNFILRPVWRSRIVDGQTDGSSLFEEEGEDMVGFDIDPARRDALDRRRGTPRSTDDRLSRELEEGFMDDSEEEDSYARQSQNGNR